MTQTSAIEDIEEELRKAGYKKIIKVWAKVFPDDINEIKFANDNEELKDVFFAEIIDELEYQPRDELEKMYYFILDEKIKIDSDEEDYYFNEDEEE